MRGVDYYNYRRKKGMSEKELADNVGITKEEVLDIEAGERTPLFSKRMKIFKALGIMEYVCPHCDGKGTIVRDEP